jgi:hypothetical protein
VIEERNTATTTFFDQIGNGGRAVSPSLLNYDWWTRKSSAIFGGECSFVISSAFDWHLFRITPAT